MQTGSVGSGAGTVGSGVIQYGSGAVQCGPVWLIVTPLHYIGCVECILVTSISPNSNWLGLGISIENLSYSNTLEIICYNRVSILNC